MSLNNKSPDHHIAYGAATEGFAAASTSLGVIGRYWWNVQMQLLVATGTMRFFRAYWWLFLVAGFLLLAFVMPLGVAFVVSAFCAGAMNPKAEDNFIVPLRHEDNAPMGEPAATEPDEAVFTSQPDSLEDVHLAAGMHHVGYLTAIKRDLDDKEIAAAALGAFDGTVQAFGLKLSDLDMHTNGAAFIVAQLTALERMDEVDPEWIAEVTEEAMTSETLEAIRAEAGRFAFTMEGAMQNGPDQPTS
ncbi:hypothetical protein Ga0609869_000461 [Rhodovulum iodosum]|uniref:Uncharacterized protein n=1 Tax=Rhodovulum iodosum TaxID=68291 RepID=A0ABV3XRU6_9RHOB|nr:hypothetical protein [Rhodovulum robiginosum]RSK31584.1 hypothetical protein EJA01_15765 [Rhodovulum robiginosum]